MITPVLDSDIQTSNGPSQLLLLYLQSNRNQQHSRCRTFVYGMQTPSRVAVYTANPYCITYAISITYAMFVTGPPAQQPLGPTVQQQPTTNESWRYDAGYLQGKEDAKLKGTHTQEFLSGYAKGIKEYFTPGNCIRRSTEGNSYARVHVWIHQWDSRLLV
jgi:hypothetical protein